MCEIDLFTYGIYIGKEVFFYVIRRCVEGVFIRLSVKKTVRKNEQKLEEQ